MIKSIVTGLTLISTLALPPLSSAADEVPRAEARDLFEQRRELESRSHLERIRILRDAEACIQAAMNLHDYRACERNEAEARRSLREQQKPRLETLRERIRELRPRLARLRARNAPDIH